MPHVQRRRRVELEAPVAEVETAVGAAIDQLESIQSFAFEHVTTPHDDGGPTRLDLTVESSMRIPYFHWFYAPIIRRTARRQLAFVIDATRAALAGEHPPEPPAPPFLLASAAFDEEAVQLLAVAAAIGALASFGAALFGQNSNSVAKSFGASNADLGVALAITRVGVLVALITTALADRHGRRRILAVSFAGLCIANAVTALAPNLVLFTGSQLLVRAFVNSTLVVAGIAVIEEAPENARALAATTFALASGAGFALSVILLPLADLGGQAWRIPFALSGLSIVFLPRLIRRLPETRRYRALASRTEARGGVREVMDRAYGPRFALLAAVAFLTGLFSAPSAQLTNKYLDDTRGFSNSGISLFRGVTNGLPGLAGLVIGGRLAERRGRRGVAAIGLGIASLAQITFFLIGGPSLWVASTVAILFAGGATVALGTLDAELFPTEVRGTGNALLLVSGVAGAVVGLLLAGLLADTLGGLGPAIAVCGLAPVLAATFLIPRLPEAAHRDLDDVSPSEV